MPVTQPFAGGQINSLVTIGSGDNEQVFSTQAVTTAQSLRSYQGTAGSPDTGLVPVIRAVRTQQVTSGIVGDGSEQLAAISGISVGTATTQGQPVGVFCGATTASTQSGQNDDCCAGYSAGIVTGSGTGIGIGHTFLGRTDSASGNANPIQACVYNGSGSAGAYNSAGFTGKQGIWLWADGGRAGAALTIGNPSAQQFDVGIACTSQGTGGPILTTFIRDDSSAATSILVNGTHATASIAVAASAGTVLIGGTASVSSTSALMEIQGSNVNLDPLFWIGSVANSKEYTIRVRNSVGQARFGVCGATNDFFTGTAAGDGIIGTSTSAKALHIGGTLKVVTVTTANTLGFFSATPVAQQAAYTQTYSTATRTHSNLTSATLTDNSAGTANTTLQALTDGVVYANDVAAIRNNYADLAASNNAIIADLTNLKGVVNSLIDDAQAYGLAT